MPKYVQCKDCGYYMVGKLPQINNAESQMFNVDSLSTSPYVETEVDYCMNAECIIDFDDKYCNGYSDYNTVNREAYEELRHGFKKNKAVKVTEAILHILGI